MDKYPRIPLYLFKVRTGDTNQKQNDEYGVRYHVHEGYNVQAYNQGGERDEERERERE